MVRKISRQGPGSGGADEKKSLRPKRLRLKKLHKSLGEEREALKDVDPAELPPASSSNAARQVRSRLNNTFPVDWQKLHLTKSPDESEDTGDSDR